MKKKIFIITFLCMIAFAAMIVSDKIYKSADMTERVWKIILSQSMLVK